MRQSKAFSDLRGSEVALDMDEILSLSSHFTKDKRIVVKRDLKIFSYMLKKKKNSSKPCFQLNSHLLVNYTFCK